MTFEEWFPKLGITYDPSVEYLIREACKKAFDAGRDSADDDRKMITQCPVCGKPATLRFTKGKGKPYVSCGEHQIQALLLGGTKVMLWKKVVGALFGR